MAYNPYQAPAYTYNQNGYNTYNPPYMNYAHGTQSSVIPQNQNQGTLLTVFVDSEQEVNDYPVAAGTTVQLISFKMGKFYLKSTGTNGVPQPIRSFTFVEDEIKTNNQNDSVSRDEFNALNDKLDKLIAELGGDK